MTTSVVVGYCSGAEVSAVFHHCLMQVVIHESETGRRHILAPGGGAFGSIGTPRIATARNGIVRTFLKSAQSEWLWMVDTDMAFKPDVLERLLAVADPDERPIVGGLCFGRTMDGLVYPTLYKLVDDGTRLAWFDSYDKGMIKVDATGAACLLMHRSALDAVANKYPPPMEWFQDTVWNGNDTGEDVTFCFRLADVGIPVYVDTTIRIGHVKSMIFDEHTFNSQLGLTGEQQ